MAIVYFHRRKDTNEIFYVGIGKTRARAKSTQARSNFWKGIVKKYGYYIEIAHSDLTWDEACELEIKYIKEFGRRDLGLGNLVNMTDGGEGVIGKSVDARRRIGEAHRGKKLSKETREKLSKRLKVVMNELPQETKKRMSRKGMKHTKESIKKISIAGKLRCGKPLTEDAKKKISEKRKQFYLNGGKHHMLGKSHSEETKRKISESNKGKISHNKDVPMSEEQKEKISKVRKEKGLSKGENNGRAKLTLDIANQIRQEYSEGNILQRELAVKYEVSSRLISAIVNRKVWNY